MFVDTVGTEVKLAKIVKNLSLCSEEFRFCVLIRIQANLHASYLSMLLNASEMTGTLIGLTSGLAIHMTLLEIG